MTDVSVHSTSFQVEKRSWLLGPHGTGPGENPSITLDVSAFTSGTHYPNGYILSGEPLAKLASGLYAPYVNQTNETVLIHRTATGGTVDFSLDGETKAGVSVVAATTAAQIKAALEGLPNVNVGDITVTGGAGGDWTVEFIAGPYSGVDAPNLTVDATNATGGTVTATPTGGGVEAGGAGSGTGAGLLFSAVKVPDTAVTTIDVGGALFVHGFVKVSKLPRDPGAAFWRDLPLIHSVA